MIGLHTHFTKIWRDHVATHPKILTAFLRDYDHDGIHYSILVSGIPMDDLLELRKQLQDAVHRKAFSHDGAEISWIVNTGVASIIDPALMYLK